MNANLGRRPIAGQSPGPHQGSPSVSRAVRPRLVWALLVALLVPLVVAGCDINRHTLMPVYNYTRSEITIVHQDGNGGGETVVKMNDGQITIQPAGARGWSGGMADIANCDWCSEGTFIARTTDGVEVDRKSFAPGFSICGTWDIGTPPPSASPSPAPTRTAPS
jgi:hypothetical protein